MFIKSYLCLTAIVADTIWCLICPIYGTDQNVIPKLCINLDNLRPTHSAVANLPSDVMNLVLIVDTFNYVLLRQLI